MSYGERLEAEMHQRQARQAFLDALDRLTAQQLTVSHSKRAENYAPKVMTGRGFVNGHTVRELEHAMNQLLDEGTIIASAEVFKTANRNSRCGIARTATVAGAV